MFERPLLVQAVGHGQVLGVVGDGDVLVAAGQGGIGHLADGVVAVGGGGVHVHVAADVGRLNEPGKAAVRGTLDLAQVLAHLGRHPVHAERGINLFLGCRRDDRLVVQPRQRPLAERVAHLERALAERHVVRLGSGKVLQRRAVGGRRQQAHVHLQPLARWKLTLFSPLAMMSWMPG